MQSFTLKTILLVLATGLVHPLKAQQYHFNFNSAKAKSGYITVGPGSTYSQEKGFGFDLGSRPTIADTAKTNHPFYFSVKVPEGNYKVTIRFGALQHAAAATVKAESRRLMLEDVKTGAGKYTSKTFILNIKDRKINGPAPQKINEQEQAKLKEAQLKLKEPQLVKLKERELDKLDWDDKLTLEFDQQTALQTIDILPVKDQITVYLAGNSTVVNQEDEPWASWGQMIPRFFKPGLAIANHAESGLTLGSFIGSKRLEKILSVIKPGDYLFVEFGHNDQKEKEPNDGVWRSYTDRLRLFVNQAREKSAIPVIVTSTSRRSFAADGRIENSLGDYPAAARKLAAEEKVALIDLNLMSTRFYEALGEEASKKAFVHYAANSYPGQDKPLADNTHFNPYGAYELAKCVLQGIRDNKLGITKYIIDGLPQFDPSHPDPVAQFKWFESPPKASVKPDGN